MDKNSSHRQACNYVVGQKVFENKVLLNKRCFTHSDIRQFCPIFPEFFTNTLDKLICEAKNIFGQNFLSLIFVQIICTDSLFCNIKPKAVLQTLPLDT